MQADVGVTIERQRYRAVPGHTLHDLGTGARPPEPTEERVPQGVEVNPLAITVERPEEVSILFPPLPLRWLLRLVDPCQPCGLQIRVNDPAGSVLRMPLARPEAIIPPKPGKPGLHQPDQI